VFRWNDERFRCTSVIRQFKSRYKEHRELVGRFMVFMVLGTKFNSRWLCIALIFPLREIKIKNF
ncbi:hypothetical protein, partial [Staphylococcus aureus]|uniref:hypothetical protein n=1 Tax=Staphylococcus aureus TaxID=1280 RepID=UPI0028990994